MDANYQRNTQLLEEFFALYNLFSNNRLKGKINLPQIAVLGKQSCGKSSIIANIIGVDLMPSGEGITTKACIRYQIHHWNEEVTRYVVDGKLETEVPQEVRDEIVRIWDEAIEEETKRRDESNSGERNETEEMKAKEEIIVTDREVTVDIYTKDKTALSCLDLPGMIQEVDDGIDKGTKGKIEDMVQRCVRMSNTIILFVHDSDEDFENSTIRKIIREYDPEFKRTITVLSKIDIGHKNKSEYILDLLNGNKFSTPLGYYAMRGRSKDEREAGRTIVDTINGENQFFKNNSEYDDILPRWGTERVRDWLQNILCDWVIENLQNVEEEIFNTYERYKKEFSLLGKPDSWANEDDASEVIFFTISEIVRAFRHWMEHGNPEDIERVLSGGAYVKHVVKESYSKYIKPLDFMKNCDDQMIYSIVQNFSGHHERLMSSDGPSVYLIKKKIMDFEEPLKDYALSVKASIKAIIRDIIVNTCGTKNRLGNRFIKISKDILNSLFSSISEKIDEHLSMEKESINFDRFDFRSFMHIHDKQMQLQDVRTYMTNQNYSGYIDQSFVDKVRNYYIVLDTSVNAEFYNNQGSSGTRPQEENKGEESMCDTEGSENSLFGSDLFSSVNPTRDSTGIKMYNEKASPSTIKPDLQSIPDEEKSGINETKKVVSCYWNALKKEFHDMMPRLCKHYFINQFQKELEKRLHKNERDMKNKIELASDPPEVIQNYKEVSKIVKDLEKSLEEIRDLRDNYE